MRQWYRIIRITIIKNLNIIQPYGEKMGQLPDSNDEWTIHSLNIHGAFFQNKIAYFVNNRNPSRLQFLTAEYPVEFPPNNHNKESRLDVLGYIPARFSQKSGVYLIIECKKNNPEFVDWVFYPTIQNQLFQSDYSQITVLRNCLINTNDHGRIRTELGLTNKMRFDIQISGDCRESRGDYKEVAKNVKTKTSNSHITDASYQVTLATHAIATKHNEQNNENIKTTTNPGFNINIYIPIIVTTANLYMLEYDLSDINISSGEIPFDKAKLNSVNKIFYEYPIPPHLQTNLDNNYLQPNDFQKDIRMRRYILVINANHFEETLNWLINMEELFVESD